MNKFGLKNILITGCGGDIAIAMARILRDILPGIRLVGTDIHDDHPAQAYFDQVITVLRADDPDYQSRMQVIVSEQDIELIIPSTEVEIAFFIEQGNADDAFNVPVLIANENLVKTALDKYETAQYLKKIEVL